MKIKHIVVLFSLIVSCNSSHHIKSDNDLPIIDTTFVSDNNHESFRYFLTIDRNKGKSPYKLIIRSYHNDILILDKNYSITEFNKLIDNKIPKDMIDDVIFYNIWFEKYENSTFEFLISANKPDTDYGFFVYMQILNSGEIILKELTINE